MIYKLERKFGKYAIQNLMRYVIIVYAAGFVTYLINPYFYYNWLMLDIDKILQGQIWRLVTFVIQPMDNSLLFMLLMLYVYYSIGTNLEHVWGTFRFNLYYFMGLFFNIVAVIIIYIVAKLMYGVGYSYPVSLYYINMSMFLAFAVTFPDIRFFIMFLIPVKAKYLTIAYFLLMGYDIIASFQTGVFNGICTTVCIFVAMANFFIYFMMTKKHLSPSNIKNKIEFSRSYARGVREGMQNQGINPDTGKKAITRHKCAVCGRTELDGAELEFRFCSKCNGNYEYCQDHLFTHTHVE